MPGSGMRAGHRLITYLTMEDHCEVSWLSPGPYK